MARLQNTIIIKSESYLLFWCISFSESYWECWSIIFEFELFSKNIWAILIGYIVSQKKKLDIEKFVIYIVKFPNIFESSLRINELKNSQTIIRKKKIINFKPVHWKKYLLNKLNIFIFFYLYLFFFYLFNIWVILQIFLIDIF